MLEDPRECRGFSGSTGRSTGIPASQPEMRNADADAADADAADAGPFFSHTCAYNTRWGNRINYRKVEDPILEKMNFESETCTFNRQ